MDAQQSKKRASRSLAIAELTLNNLPVRLTSASSQKEAPLGEGR